MDDSNTNTTTNRLPFVRFRLQRPPVTKPRALDHLDDDIWNHFLSQLARVASQSYDHEWVDSVARVSVFVLVGSYLALSFGTDVNRILLGIVFLVCFCLCTVWGEEIKRRDFERLKNSCREEEEKNFKPRGYFVVCHDEQKQMDGRPTGCYVYLLRTSTQSDYLRVEVAKDATCGWRIPPSLDYYDYVPDGLASIPLTVWSEFWCDLDHIASKYVSHRRRFVGIITFYCIVTTTEPLWNATVYMVILLPLLPLLLYGFYCLSVMVSIDVELERVCSDCTHKFHEHGVYLEYRKENVRTWQRYMSTGTVGRFVCMYQQATLQDA